MARITTKNKNKNKKEEKKKEKCSVQGTYG
jgi:hypothetical protein